MSQQRLTKRDIDDVLKEYNTPEKARKFLRDAGLIDENNNLTKPYQPEQCVSKLFANNVAPKLTQTVVGVEI